MSRTRKLLLVLLVISVLLLCTPVTYKSIVEEWLVSSKYYSYSFDHESILEDIRLGKGGLFTQLDEDPEGYDYPPEDPVRWAIDDYMQVVRAVHESIWKDSLENWNLSLILLDWECEDFSEGPQNAWFKFFKLDRTGGRKYRFVIEYFVNPYKNSINILKEQYWPVVYYWPIVDLEQTEISFDEVLRIAEANGGEQTRAAAEDMCYMLVVLNPTTTAVEGWEILYLTDDERVLDKYFINPETGDLETGDSVWRTIWWLYKVNK